MMKRRSFLAMLGLAPVAAPAAVAAIQAEPRRFVSTRLLSHVATLSPYEPGEYAFGVACEIEGQAGGFRVERAISERANIGA
jgi:hypothetical protein